MSLLATLLLGGSALAADPVISSGGDPRITLTRAAAASERPDTELRVVTFSDLASMHPAVIEGGGQVEECRAQPTTMGIVREAIDRAERALAYLEFDKAQAHLALGHGQLRCLSEPVDARDAARLYFLTGFVAASTQREGDARTAFRRALAFQPGFTWDDTYPPDGKNQLDALRAALDTERTELTVLPLTGRSGLWIDGKQATLTERGSVELPLGPHLVQVTTSRITSFWVDLRDDGDSAAAPAVADASPPAGDAAAGEAAESDTAASDTAASDTPPSDAVASDATDNDAAAAVTPDDYPTAGPLIGGGMGMPSERVQELTSRHMLIAPALVPVEAANWAADEAQRDELMLILSSMFDPDETVYFAASGEVIQHTVGTAEWTSLRVPTSLARAGGVNGRLVAGRSLFWGGAVATVGGVGVMGVSWLNANAATNRAKSTTDFPVYDLARTDYADAGSLMTVGRYLGLGGVVLTAAGVGLQFDNLPGILGGRKGTATASVTPTVGDQTVGLALSFQP